MMDTKALSSNIRMTIHSTTFSVLLCHTPHQLSDTTTEDAIVVSDCPVLICSGLNPVE